MHARACKLARSERTVREEELVQHSANVNASHIDAHICMHACTHRHAFAQAHAATL